MRTRTNHRRTIIKYDTLMLRSSTCTCAQLSPIFRPYLSLLADTWVVGDGLHIGQALNGLDARLYKRRALRIEPEAVHKCLSAAAPVTAAIAPRPSIESRLEQGKKASSIRGGEFK